MYSGGSAGSEWLERVFSETPNREERANSGAHEAGTGSIARLVQAEWRKEQEGILEQRVQALMNSTWIARHHLLVRRQKIENRH